MKTLYLLWSLYASSRFYSFLSRKSILYEIQIIIFVILTLQSNRCLSNNYFVYEKCSAFLLFQIIDVLRNDLTSLWIPRILLKNKHKFVMFFLNFFQWVVEMIVASLILIIFNLILEISRPISYIYIIPSSILKYTCLFLLSSMA